ncbi:hypothetical protein FI667_g3841, partial [Globisporangium splendens]
MATLNHPLLDAARPLRRVCALTALLLVAWFTLCVLVAASSDATVDVVTENPIGTEEHQTPPLDLRFEVPFNATQDLDIEYLAETQDLRVKRVLSAASLSSIAQAQVCPAEGTCSVQEDKHERDGHLMVQSSDRLVRADGVEISIKSFEEVIDGPIGSVVVLPLFKVSVDGDSGHGDANVPSGFARIEIFHPTSLEFEPTSVNRKADIQEWKTIVAKREQEELERKIAAANDVAAREQEEQERRIAEENARLERETRERLEKEELERLSMTPHDRISEKRAKGVEFRYEVEFPRNGPIGINWDLHTTHKTVVSCLEPKLRAYSLGIIAANDQLIQLNDVNTTAMGPHEVVAEYVKMTPPRTLLFLCAATAKKPVAAVDDAATPRMIQNWTLAFVEPQVLRGWHVRLHLVNWSVMPELDESTGHSAEMRLAQANPFLACLPLSPTAKSLRNDAMKVMHVVYRGECSFMDKADAVRQANGTAMLVLNNAKGEGRFPPGVPLTGNVPIPVTMISKLDGEIVLSVMERQEPVVKMFVEDPSELPVLDADPTPLTNQELTAARNVKVAGRNMTFWYINTSASSAATEEFLVLPALFGTKIPSMPYRIVAAYPQETACHHMGLGIQATRAVVLVKRGKCSFGAKMSISFSNGTRIQEILETNKNVPSLVNVAMDVQS